MREFSFTYLRVVPPLNIEQTFYIWINLNSPIEIQHCLFLYIVNKPTWRRSWQSLGRGESWENQTMLTMAGPLFSG